MSRAGSIDRPGSEEKFQDRAKEALATSRERLAQGTSKLRESITQEPVRALILALGMGVLLGWLIKRR
jgi:hypothetical protein